MKCQFQVLLLLSNKDGFVKKVECPCNDEFPRVYREPESKKFSLKLRGDLVEEIQNEYLEFRYLGEHRVDMKNKTITAYYKEV
jgi:hypothetical protein